MGPMRNHVRHIHVLAASLRSDSNVCGGRTGLSILDHMVERVRVGISCIHVHSVSREGYDN